MDFDNFNGKYIVLFLVGLILFVEKLWKVLRCVDESVKTCTVNSRYLEVVGTFFYKFKLPEVHFV